MIHKLDQDHIDNINAILEAGSILDHTITKHAPNCDSSTQEVLPNHGLHSTIINAIARTLGFNRNNFFD
jgi:hypothetical protein